MKKICALAMSIVLILCTIGTISAKESYADTDLVEALKIAYLDLENASPEMQKKILDAREKIIFSTDWVADGFEMRIEDTEGNLIRTVPSFSEVFPNWDLPVFDASNMTDSPAPPNDFNNVDATAARSSYWTRLGSFRCYLKRPTNENTNPFVEVYADPEKVGSEISTYATYLTSSETCNIGYTNMKNGASLGHKSRLTLGEVCIITGIENMKVGIRASTYSTPGWAELAVDTGGRIIHLRSEDVEK